ncbi:unnamed protein product [Amoebophrya sp. A25]|nr:unnamed protein product [Amoebophrya sp. A25]|eukprot:GSA25T00004496001.1
MSLMSKVENGKRHKENVAQGTEPPSLPRLVPPPPFQLDEQSRKAVGRGTVDHLGNSIAVQQHLDSYYNPDANVPPTGSNHLHVDHGNIGTDGGVGGGMGMLMHGAPGNTITPGGGHDQHLPSGGAGFSSGVQVGTGPAASSSSSMAQFHSSAQSRMRNYVGAEAVRVTIRKRDGDQTAVVNNNSTIQGPPPGADPETYKRRPQFEINRRSDMHWQIQTDGQAAKLVVKDAIANAVGQYGDDAGGGFYEDQDASASLSHAAAIGAFNSWEEKFLPSKPSTFSFNWQKEEKFLPSKPSQQLTEASTRLPNEMSHMSSVSTQYVGRGSARRENRPVPAPGEYRWNDNVNKHKSAVWTLKSANRENLDPRVTAWVSASNSMTTPPPGTYGDLGKYCPRVGKIELKTFKFGNSKSERKLTNFPSQDLMYNMPPILGTWKHPTQHVAEGFSVVSCNRTHLSNLTTSWLPLQKSNRPPGPGIFSPGRWPECSQKSFHNRKKGPAFGRRIDNLSTLVPTWIPETFSQRHFKATAGTFLVK